MAYNHAGAEKAYALQQEENRKQYRAAGMSDKEIQEIEKYDRSVFLSDRRFYENTSGICTIKGEKVEPENPNK